MSVFVVFHTIDSGSRIITTTCSDRFEVLQQVRPSIKIHSVVRVHQSGVCQRFEIIFKDGKLELEPVDEAAAT